MPLQPSGFVTNTAGDIVAIQNADSSITRLADTQSSATPIRVVSVAATMSTTTVSNTGGLVTLTGAGVHGLTTANVVTPTTPCNVYVTWTGTGKAGVDGLYVINAQTSTTAITIRLPFVSSTVTFTIANAAYSASTLYRLGDLVTDSGLLYVCNVASSFGRTAPNFGEDFILADSSRNGGIVNWTAHGRSVNDPITLSTSGALPAALSASLYYVKRIIDANRFTLSSTVGGAEIVITDVGTPTNTATLFYGTPTVTPVATAITMLSLPVAANTLTERGSLRFDGLMSVATSVNNKTTSLGFGTAANLYSAAQTTAIGQVLSKQGWRCGANKFITSATSVNGHVIGTAALQSLTIDATADQQFIVRGTMAVANEVMTLEAYRLEVD